MESTKTELLVNPHRLRDSVRRLFDGTPDRVISEMLQNSQRAKASTVRIKTNSSGFSFEDNGHGIEGTDGFYKLLCLADSGYSEQVEKDQNPMGLGFASLLANEQVKTVTIQSGGLSLEIECERWWREIDYYSTWASRLQNCNFFSGFLVIVTCHPTFVNAIHNCLPTEISGIKSGSWQEQIQRFPALGYEDILEIKIDDQTVYTWLPPGYYAQELVTEFEWEGAKIEVYNPTEFSKELKFVSWYGQLIPVSDRMPFSFLVTVRGANPLVPKAPVRDSLVENEAKASLVKAIADAIFRELCSLESNKITVHNIETLYKLDFQRAINECPYFIASPCLSYERGQNSEEVDSTGESKVFLSHNYPVLIENKVRVILSDEPEAEIVEYHYGISSFVDCLKAVGITPYQVDVGSIFDRVIYWKPGKPNPEANNKTNTNWFYGRGHWAIGQDNEIDNLQ